MSRDFLKAFVLSALIGAGALHPGPTQAGEVTIEAVTATKRADGSYRFDVTLRHDDTGWDHYADGWEVLSPTGESLGYRKLHHPHVEEQPFTRSLSGVVIPEGVNHVFLRAHDSVHGWTAGTVRVDLD